jgi:phosphatidyl-myo-inositol dimannoside synthase
MNISIICFKFEKENLRRQPWRYVYEIAKYLIINNVSVTIISDSKDISIDGIKIHKVKFLYSFFGESKELLEAIKEEDPDIIVMLLGQTSFLRTSCKINEINKPIIGILTSPINSLNDLAKIGYYEIINHFNYVLIHLLGALIPSYLICKFCDKLECIVVLSEDNKKKLKRIGIKTEIALIPPGIDNFFLEWPDQDQVMKLKKRLNPGNLPVIMYFTSPLTLRGTDTLIKAFAEVRKSIPSKLIFLSRMEQSELSKEERVLKEIAINEGILGSIEFVSELLSAKEIKEYLSIADIISLPFKIIISDVPLSILEAMALGKAVIATNIGCIPELINGRGLIVNPNDFNGLANSINLLLNNKDLKCGLENESRKFMVAYPKWNEIGFKFMNIALGSVGK